jgi:hypothetical protein
MKNVEIEISATQAQLVATAIRAEVVKGRETFLSVDDVEKLLAVAYRLETELRYV